jgi:hypothetical protein
MVFETTAYTIPPLRLGNDRSIDKSPTFVKFA